VVKGLLHRAELTSGALRSYLDTRLGPDRRYGESNYEVWVGVLRQLGFTSLQQVDDCIDGLDDTAISRAVWAPKKRPQLDRFEGLLLAGMGEYYIERHPSGARADFVLIRRRWLDRLVEHALPVRSYRPR
jgi:hypothetical protein